MLIANLKTFQFRLEQATIDTVSTSGKHSRLWSIGSSGCEWPSKWRNHPPVQRRQIRIANACRSRCCSLGYSVDTVVAWFAKRKSTAFIYGIVLGHFANTTRQSANTSWENVGCTARFVQCRLRAGCNKASVGRKCPNETTETTGTVARHRCDSIKRLQSKSANIIANEAVVFTVEYNGECHTHTECTEAAQPWACHRAIGGRNTNKNPRITQRTAQPPYHSGRHKCWCGDCATSGASRNGFIYCLHGIRVQHTERGSWSTRRSYSRYNDPDTVCFGRQFGAIKVSIENLRRKENSTLNIFCWTFQSRGNWIIARKNVSTNITGRRWFGRRCIAN